MNEDEKWMKYAIKEAKKAQIKNEIPVGSIIVLNNKIIARAHNQSIFKNDPTAHAEIQVLQKAGKKLQNYRLNNTTLYVTLEPCAMCFGAISHARINRVVFGAYDHKTGVCGSSINLCNEKIFNHKIIITGGILEKQCSQLLKSFFKLLR
jgi:tRNA(adenine34) deaminase